MNYSIPGFLIVALIAVLVVAPIVAGTPWEGGQDLGVALVRTGEVLAGAVLLLVLVELTRRSISPEDRETAIVLTCGYLALLVTLFSVEQHLRRGASIVPSARPGPAGTET